MKLILSVPDPAHIPAAKELRPDLIELRLDLSGPDSVSRMREAAGGPAVPVILTLRSDAEGGRFTGSTGEWLAAVRPFLPYGEYIDVESRFSAAVPELRASGKTIIASLHTGEMPSAAGLREIERDLREFGDIPKIVVSPRDEPDVIELLRFTGTARPPVITSIMGQRFAWARPLLPLFGSSHFFCHGGRPTSEGQFHIGEVREIFRLLGRPLADPGERSE